MDKEKIRELTQQIIDGLDIVDEYRKLGLKFPNGAKPRPSGFISCFAAGREDKKPSACIHLASGYYRDSGGRNESLSLFDFAARYGGFTDWKEARFHYAKQLGLEKRLPRKEREYRDRFAYASQAVPLLVSAKQFLNANPPITAEAVTLAGGKLAKYPARSEHPQYVIVFPIFDERTAECGAVMARADGRPVVMYQGEDAPPIKEKVLTVPGSSPGLMGAAAFANWETAHTVFKVEGLTDLLALQSAIPADKRDEYVVVSNAFGATELGTPQRCAPLFAGKHVAVIHDADQAGDYGAKLWTGQLVSVAESVRHVRLPYEIQEKKGGDLRDWLSEGHTFADLLDLYQESTPVSEQIEAEHTDQQNDDTLDGESTDQKDSESLSPDEVILNTLGIVVVGQIEETGHVVLFSSRLGKISRWSRSELRQAKRADFILEVGGHVRDHLTESGEAGKITIPQLREAIMFMASRRPVRDADKMGAGVWQVNNHIALVGHRKVASVWQGQLIESRVPRIAGRMLKFPGEDWYDSQTLEGYINQAESIDWCRETIREAVGLFARWDNWQHDKNPEIAAGLAVASWIQHVWPWRPEVVVTGPSGCGKTFLLENALCGERGKGTGLFGRLAQYATKSTEAGIRQKIGHTTRILILDEFEHDKHRQQILDLIRTGSRGGEMLRGTQMQDGQEFGMQHIVWLGAIEMGLDRAPDLNRAIILELGHVPPKDRVMQLPSERELQDLGQRLLAIGLRHWQAMTDLSVSLADETISGIDPRVVASYSVPVAVLSVAAGLGRDQARYVLQQALQGRSLDDTEMSDEATLLHDILWATVWGQSGLKMAVRHLLESNSYDLPHDLSPDRELMRVGIRKVERQNGESGLFLVPRVIRRELLKSSEFGQINPKSILKRIKGAQETRQRMGENWARGIFIPQSSIENLLQSAQNQSDFTDDEF